MALHAAEMAVLLTVYLSAAACLECRKNRSLWIGFLFLFMALGFWRMEGARAEADRMREMGLAEAGQQRISGIAGGLEEKTYGWGAELLEARLEPSGEELGRVSAFFEARPGFEAGDRILVSGELAPYDPASNPGEFDYRAYYDSRGMYWKASAESWERLPGGNPLRRMLGRIREHSAGVLDACAGENAGIFKAMLLGLKGDIPDEVYALYQESGISHLLAISGLHVSMLGMGFYGLLGRLGMGKRPQSVLAAGFMVLYGVMTGFSPSTRRAVIMFLASMASGWAGRTYDLPSALSLAALAILWRNPQALTQGGVQLSFLAVGGIGALNRAMEGAGLWKSRAGKVLGSGLAVQFATYPAVAWHFFVYPPYSIFLNLLVIPMMTYAMVSGLLCLALGSVSLSLGKLCVGGGYYILKCYEALCALWGRLPGSSLVIGRPALWQIAVYGVVLGAAVLLAGRLRRKGLWLAGNTALLFFMLFPLPRGGFSVTYLDVGQGDGIVAEAGACRILFDGGSSDEKRVGEQVLTAYLHSRGIRSLDYAVVSHCDGDHISGLETLLESGAVEIGTLALPKAGAGEEAWEELASLARVKGVGVLSLEAGDQIQAGKLTLSCLYPFEGAKLPADRNERSLVVKLEYGEASFLFTGDIGAACEEEMLKNPAVRRALAGCTVLKVAHHGSASSSSEAFLEAVRPKYGVISYGAGNSYGHPAPETVERLSEAGVRVFETARDGAVTVRTDGRSLEVKTFLSAP